MNLSKRGVPTLATLVIAVALTACNAANVEPSARDTPRLDFGEGNHATYRWHVVILAG
jgi:hypothetical protein